MKRCWKNVYWWRQEKGAPLQNTCGRRCIWGAQERFSQTGPRVGDEDCGWKMGMISRWTDLTINSPHTLLSCRSACSEALNAKQNNLRVLLWRNWADYLGKTRVSSTKEWLSDLIRISINNSKIWKNASIF